MRALEEHYSTWVDNYSIMLHKKNDTLYFESKYFDYRFISYFFVKIFIKKEDFFQKQIQNLYNFQYCRLKNEPYLVCYQVNPTDTIMLYRVVKDASG